MDLTPKTLAALAVAVMLAIAQWGINRAVNELDGRTAQLAAADNNTQERVRALELESRDMVRRAGLDDLRADLARIDARLAELAAGLRNVERRSLTDTAERRR